MRFTKPNAAFRQFRAQLDLITTIDEGSYTAWLVRNREALRVGFARSGQDPDEAPVYTREQYIRAQGVQL